jgi:membrane protein implicated in regulation of membrane protease activity
MSSHGGRIGSFFAWIYYGLGGLYYVHAWILISGGLAAILAAVSTYFQVSWLWYATTAAAFVLFLIAAIIYLRFMDRRFQTVNPELKVDLQENVFKILGQGRFVISRKISCIPSKDGVSEYRSPFTWTGEGDPPNTLGDGHLRIVRDKRIAELFCVYSFERPTSKGERIDFVYSFELSGTKTEPQPFYSTTIRDPVRRQLSIRVIFPSNAAPHSYRRTIFKSDLATVPLWESSELVSSNNECTWVIKRPRPGYQYHISW